jgi:hypothetical protein
LAVGELDDYILRDLEAMESQRASACFMRQQWTYSIRIHQDRDKRARQINKTILQRLYERNLSLHNIATRPLHRRSHGRE